MKVSFADSFFYLALLNPRDASHAAASEVAREIAGEVFTTQWVLTEVADALSNPIHRPSFDRLLATIMSDSRVRIVEASDIWFQRGIDLYRQRPDKSWSLTDCISFAVMAQYQISDALTADHHFQQAGFNLAFPQGI